MSNQENREDSFIELKKKLDALGLDRNDPTTFANCTPMYCRLLRLILTLPVSTATTEQSFSALKIVKTRLRTSMGDSWTSDLLGIYIEKEFSRKIPINDIVEGFKRMGSRHI